MSKTIKAVFNSGVFAKTLKVFEWDTDDKLQFVGVDLPDNYTVDFSNSLTGESKPVLGDASGVAIPPEYFVPGTEIYAWVWISTENGGHTKYQVTIPVYKRAKRTGTTPTPAQQDALDQAIAKMNEYQDRVFWATYGETGYADILSAYEAEKNVLLLCNGKILSLIACGNGDAQFGAISQVWAYYAAVNASNQWSTNEVQLVSMGILPYQIEEVTGDPDDLTTTAKSNLVAAINEVKGGKLDKAQGVSNAGKFLVVGSNGNITAVTMTAWQGGMY